MPPAPQDAGTERSAFCPSACARLSEMGCPEGRRASDGRTCSELCVALVEARTFAISPECIMEAKTDEQLHGCNVRCTR